MSEVGSNRGDEPVHGDDAEMAKPESPLLAARKARGLSMPKLAALAGTSHQQIDRLEKGERKLTKEWALRLAPILGVTPEQLMFGITSTAPNATLQLLTTSLRLVGVVEAGAWRDVTTADYPEREVSMPRDDRFPRAQQFVLEVRGDSMNAAKPVPITDGAKLRCVDFADSGLELRTGQIAIVQRVRDGGHLIETTVKRVVVLDDRIELRPESTNPAHQPIIWNETTEKTGETRVLALVTAVVQELAI